MKKLLIAAAAMTALGLASQANAATWPSIGADTAGPSLIITVNSAGVASIAAGPSTGPYDGSDDTYIGVVNHFGQSIHSLVLTSSGQDIFGFDDDGIDATPYNAPGNAIDTTGYGGPQSYFTNINAALTSGTVNFIGGLAPGASTYFSLEEPLDAASFSGGGGIVTGGVPEPATWAMMLLGVAGVGGMLRRGGKPAMA